jgi:hypothetical protein
VFAETINLKCDIEFPYKSENIDAKIDIEERFMQFGWITYDITMATDDYITAVSNNKDEEVGHDVWVQNRINGNFIRAYVGLVCTDDSCIKKKKLNASTFEGICKKKLF